MDNRRNLESQPQQTPEKQRCCRPCVTYFRIWFRAAVDLHIAIIIVSFD